MSEVKTRQISPLVRRVCEAMEFSSSAEDAAEDAIRAVRKWDKEESIAPLSVHETPVNIYNWLQTRMPELVKSLNEAPQVAKVLRQICEGIFMYCSHSGIEAKYLRPTSVVTPEGKVVVTLR